MARAGSPGWGWAASPGASRGRPLTRLMALVNQANLVREAAAALDREGNRPPQPVIGIVDGVADAIRDGRGQVVTSRPWGTRPGARALQEALAGVAHLISGKVAAPAVSPAAKPLLRDRAEALRDRGRGRFSRMFGLRVMGSIGVAGWLSEVLALARSYWVVLTVAIVLKPDFGSVFARALQRGIGTILGAVLGAIILAVVPYGPWLLIPYGILAALLPYGQSRNHGLFATFLTPLVVVLIDLLAPAGWHLALDRLLDTLLGCAIVLLVGYPLAPETWQAHRARPDLRAEFQRPMPARAAISRRAAAWWPALVGLEEVLDEVTATTVAIACGAPAPSPGAVRQLDATLGAAASTVEDAAGRSGVTELPSDEPLKRVTEAVRSVLTVLASGKPPALASS